MYEVGFGELSAASGRMALGGPSSRLCYDVEVIIGQQITARIPANNDLYMTISLALDLQSGRKMCGRYSLGIVGMPSIPHRVRAD